MTNKSNIQFVRKVHTKKPKTIHAKKSKPKKLTKSELQNKPLSFQIKYELQQHGIKASVRKHSGGYSTAYFVTVDKKDKEKVRQITNKFEDYERDIATGEILLGGNTYIFVQDKYD